MANAQEALDMAAQAEREVDDLGEMETAPAPVSTLLPPTTEELVAEIREEAKWPEGYPPPRKDKKWLLELADRVESLGASLADSRETINALHESIRSLERVAQQRLEHASAEVERRRQATGAFSRMMRALGFTVDALRPLSQLGSVAPAHRPAAAEKLLANRDFLEHASSLVAMHDALTAWNG